MKKFSDDGINGYFIGAVAGFFSAVALLCLVFSWSSASSFVAWLEKWQTLVSGFMALVAGIGSVFYLHKQIQHMREQELDRLGRRLRAASAAMPASLADIAEYIDKVLSRLASCQFEAEAAKMNRCQYLNFAMPSAPHSAIAALYSFVEKAPVEHALNVSDFLRNLQVAESRVRGMNDEGVSEYNFSIFVLNWLDAKIACDELFEYTPSGDNGGGISNDSVLMWARKKGFSEGQHPLLFKRIRSRAGATTPVSTPSCA